MDAENREQQKKKRNIILWICSGIASLTLLLTNLGNLIEAYEKLPFTIKIEDKERPNEVKVDETNPNKVEPQKEEVDEVEPPKVEVGDVRIVKTPESNGEIDLEELVNSETTYRYRIRVITYSSETSETHLEKINRARSFKDELNNVLQSGKYDGFIGMEGRKILEKAEVVQEETDKYYIYVYINQSSGTIEDMVRDARVLEGKYEAMFKQENWLGSDNEWNGLIVDYSDDYGMKNKKSLSSEDLFNLERQLHL